MLPLDLGVAQRSIREGVARGSPERDLAPLGVATTGCVRVAAEGCRVSGGRVSDGLRRCTWTVLSQSPIHADGEDLGCTSQHHVVEWREQVRGHRGGLVCGRR